MDTIKTIGIKSLKDNLSAYIREVRRGTRVLVTDRDEVVAELCEPFSAGHLKGGNPLLAQWSREGKIRRPLVAKTSCPVSPITSPAGTAQRLIDEDRSI